VVQLHRDIEKIHAAGAELVVIGSGAAHFVAGFRETTGYKGPILVDPKLVSYRAAGLRRGWLRILNPLSLLYFFRALFRGNFQGRNQGVPDQQGGAMVVAPPGRILYEHQSRVAGDNAPPRKILAALPA
jgi:hypothetical protein